MFLNRYICKISIILQLCGYQRLQKTLPSTFFPMDAVRNGSKVKVLGNKAWNHNFVSKPARVFEAKCIDCRRKCTEIQGEKSPKGTFPIISVSHPTPAPALNNFCQLQIGCKDQLFENWKSSIFYLRYNVVWCSHLKIWSAAAAGYFEGNMKLCTFFQKERNVKPLPFAASSRKWEKKRLRRWRRRRRRRRDKSWFGLFSAKQLIKRPLSTKSPSLSGKFH